MSINNDMPITIACGDGSDPFQLQKSYAMHIAEVLDKLGIIDDVELLSFWAAIINDSISSMKSNMEASLYNGQ